MNLKKYDIVNSKHSIFVGCSLIIFALTFLSGCWGSTEKSTEPKLTVINVLDPSYFDDCHIKGSINIPFELFEEKIKTLSKNDHYVLYCSNYACTAAPFSAQLLQEAGFANVKLLPGGIVEWYQKGFPCNGPAQLQYLHEENQPFADDGHGDLHVISPEKLLEKLKAAGLV